MKSSEWKEAALEKLRQLYLFNRRQNTLHYFDILSQN